MPIARSGTPYNQTPVNQASDSTPITKPDSNLEGEMSFHSIPYEVYRYFSVNPLDPKVGDGDIREIKTIYDWTKRDGGVGDAISQISQLERKVGQGDNRIKRLYNYVRVNSVIEGMEAKKKSDMQSARTKHDSLMKRIEAEKKQAEAEVRAKHDAQLKQYKKIKSAYER